MRDKHAPGYTLKEAEEKTGIPANTLRQRAHRRKLRSTVFKGRMYLHPADVEAIATTTWRGNPVVVEDGNA